jgi:hypothetical protein
VPWSRLNRDERAEWRQAIFGPGSRRPAAPDGRETVAETFCNNLLTLVHWKPNVNLRVLGWRLEADPA